MPTNALIPHFGTFSAIVQQITCPTIDRVPATMITPGGVWIDLFPAFVRLCHVDQKCALLNMLSGIHLSLRELIGQKQFAAIWEGLEIAIYDTNMPTQNSAIRMFIRFCCDDNDRKQGYEEEIFNHLLKVMEIYCRYHCLDHSIDDEKRIFTAMKYYCKIFEHSIASFCRIQ